LFTKERKAYTWWGQNALHQVARGWDLEEINNHELDSPS